MRIKIPKKVAIGADVFKVNQNPKWDYSEFNWGERRLTIGTKNRKQLGSLWNAIVHEVMEMWTCSLYIRYYKPDAETSYEFHFDHRLFTILCENSSKTLLEFIE